LRDASPSLKNKCDREVAKSREGRREGESDFLIDFAAFQIFFASSFAPSRSHLSGA
jgi:hypothetical protein